MDNVANQHEVTIEFEGQTISGTYSVWAGTITVTSPHGRKLATHAAVTLGIVRSWLRTRKPGNPFPREPLYRVTRRIERRGARFEGVVGNFRWLSRIRRIASGRPGKSASFLRQSSRLCTWAVESLTMTGVD